MSRLDSKCDNPKCGVHIKEGEGSYWIGGQFLCKKCRGEWNERYGSVIKSAPEKDKWEQYEKTDEKTKNDNTIDKKSEKVVVKDKKAEKKNWFG